MKAILSGVSLTVTIIPMRYFCVPSNPQTEVEDCQALIRLLKQPGRLPDYEKNKDFFDTLKPLQAVAVQRAKTRSEQIQNQGIEPISRQSNPLTTVYELVEYLNSKI